MKTPCPRLSLVSATLLALASSPSSAAILFTITPSLPFQSVVEGLPGVIEFTVLNVGTDDLTIKEVRFPLNGIDESFRFLSGDKNDEVFSTQIVNGQRCVGKTLSTKGSCSFQQLFETRDLDKGASGTNSGIWEIRNAVSLVVGDTVIGRATVEVLDPGAVPSVPEPSTQVLAGAGLAVLGWLARHRRRASERVQAR